MKPIQLIIPAFFTCLLALAQPSYAYETGKPEEICKTPKILEFNLPEYAQPDKHEVAAESEFSFKVTGDGIHPEKVKVTAKGKALPLQTTQNSSFIGVKGKLPAEFTGEFVRFDVLVTADLGCRARGGWLVKVAGPAAATPAPAAAESSKPAEPSANAQ